MLNITLLHANTSLNATVVDDTEDRIPEGGHRDSGPHPPTPSTGDFECQADARSGLGG